MKQMISFEEEFEYEKSITVLHQIGSLIAPTAFRQRFPDFPWDNVVDLLDYNFSYEELCPADAVILRQYHALFSKLEPLELGINKEEVAYESFMESEVNCKLTNDVFKNRAAGLLSFNPAVEERFLSAQRKIASILGDAPPLAEIPVRFGPGANTKVKKQNASWGNKLSPTNLLACSEPLVPYLSEVLYELPMILPFNEEQGTVTVEIVNGNLSFVPKNAKTYRSIVVEPPLNGIFQAGIDTIIRSRLLSIGLDLRKQEPNQVLARVGSLTGELATLDLSSASDSISYELVAFLLPPDWFGLLKRFRTSTVNYRGSEIKLEKFSSMGNGFTFPLESLIFYALSSAVAGKTNVRVYGDDIIVPSKHAQELTNLLELSGFKLNRQKSFVEGPFRESCGADYLRGINIRPFYQKTLISCADLFRIHNFFMKEWYLEESNPIIQYVKSLIAPHVLLYGPDNFGDGHLVSDKWGKAHNRDKGYGGYVFDTYSQTTKLDFKIWPGDRLLPVYSIYTRETQAASDIRRTTLRDFAKSSSNLTNVGLPVKFGIPRSTLPGGHGYKRISIYTLVAP